VLNANGIDASAREGEHSQFDVISDGEVVFSKQREGRFPEEDELLGLLSAR
jgi:predicted Rdx family selenoprotein